MTEDAQCMALAEGLRTSAEVRAWLLERTSFRDHRAHARLLDVEMLAARPAKAWWRHWWSNLPNGWQAETDVFLVFEVPQTGARFAIFVENKKAKGKFTPNQPEKYAMMAAHWAGKPKYLNYTSHQTVLLAPQSFRDRFPEECGMFDCFIPHEEVAAVLPAFSVH